MGVTTNDIFGNAMGAEPATPGSYGEKPAGYRLPDSLKLGAVKLQVSDLNRSIDYYNETLGLRTIDKTAMTASLAAEGETEPLVELKERKGAKSAPRRGRLGLFHFAILLPDRPSLARFVKHLEEINAQAGAADHLVSEAFYLQDPDNLGIEIYADRPRNSWRRVGRELMMATDPVDVGGLVALAGDSKWSGMPKGTVMGHLHLHVGDLTQANAFYGEAIGYDRMVWQYPGALFFGAGGYHHHLGNNTWAGANAAAPGPDDAQLLEWRMKLGSPKALEALEKNATDKGFKPARDGEEFVVKDPWGTVVQLS